MSENTLLPAVVPNRATDVDFLPVMSTQLALERRDQLKQFVKAVLVDGSDFGPIPGTKKNVLLKPGAEKLANLFGLSVSFEFVSRVEAWFGVDPATGFDFGRPFFNYLVRCTLSRGDLVIASADGSCNSAEEKYGYRWVSESAMPADMDKTGLASRNSRAFEYAFAIDKAETSGPYGKPAAHWEKWRTAVDSGEAIPIKKKSKAGKDMEAYEMGGVEFRVPNPDVASLVNTLMKMAEKRALVAAVLIGVGASDYFTQDLDDEVEVGTSQHAPVEQDVEQATQRVRTDGERAASATVTSQSRPATTQRPAQPAQPAQQKPAAPAAAPAQKEAKAIRTPDEIMAMNPTQLLSALTSFAIKEDNWQNDIAPQLAAIVAKINSELPQGFEPIDSADSLNSRAGCGAVARACIVRAQRMTQTVAGEKAA